MAAKAKYKKAEMLEVNDYLEAIGPLSFGTICVGEHAGAFVPFEVCLECRWRIDRLDFGRYCCHEDALENWRKLNARTKRIIYPIS